MKFILLTLMGITTLINHSYSQDYSTICLAITSIDNRVKKLDNNIKSVKVLNDTTLIDTIVKKELLPYFIFEGITQEEIIARLDCINSTETITWLEWNVIKEINRAEQFFKENLTFSSSLHTPSYLKKIQTLIHKRTEDIMETEFSLYGFTESTNKLIKAVYFEHQNDFLSIYNQDRDLTGSFRFEIATDRMKLRVFSSYLDKSRNLNSRNWYSYQGLFVGGEGYTPYLRDTTIFSNINSFDTLDRPYASFKYFGWAKYRVSRLGRARINTQLKFGKIGTATGGKIQSTIHQDLTISSFSPNGWNAQIASGGRIAFSFEGLYEWSIFRHSDSHPNYFNPSLIGEGTIGHDKTSATVGFNLSNRSLKERAGWNVSFINKSNKYITYNIKGYMRYVLYNSMLEGYGIFYRTPDENHLSPQDVYFLTRGRNNSLDQINEFVYGTEFSLGFSFKYFNIIYKASIWSPEYDLPVNTITYAFAKHGKPGSHNISAWNHTGTLGFIFKI